MIGFWGEQNNHILSILNARQRLIPILDFFFSILFGFFMLRYENSLTFMMILATKMIFIENLIFLINKKIELNSTPNYKLNYDYIPQVNHTHT